MGSKGGVLKALIGWRKIAEFHFSSIIEDPQRPNHSYTLALRRLATSRPINEEGISRKLCGQANRFAFARIKPSQRGVERDCSHVHFKPCWMRSHSLSYLGRCAFIL
jgi:hypothetical protein